MDIPVYLQRAHKDPDDVTGKAVLFAGAYAQLPEAEAEKWIANGWATPVDPDRFYAHLEAKQADPIGYSKVQEQSMIQAKATALAAQAERQKARPSLAVLAKRKAELRSTAADRREANREKMAADAALARAAALAGGTLTEDYDDDEPE